MINSNQQKPYMYVRAEDVDNGCIAEDSDDTDDGDEHPYGVVPVVGDHGEVVPVGVDEEGVGIKDVGGCLVHWDVRHSSRREVGCWNKNI